MKDDPVLEDLLEHRYASLVGYATLVSGARQDAEDLVHDAIVTVFSKRRRFTSLEHAHAYVLRAIASRHVDARRSWARRASREERATSLAPRFTPGPEDSVGMDDAVVTALAALSPRERACVVMRHLADQSVADTAHALGISEGAVKRYTSDGLAALVASGLLTEAAAQEAGTEQVDVRIGGAR
ncbi:RNA polymerase sigma factor [Demequina zhanjiangensis]|uniref:Sigma-70 family RNA polymerase sigma factor n=1 Tax=Demequina zhanjiangensis TaxID=3051659 RepID=A0ABT8FWX5_9MICO|nr:sigma-70 family RNA polymerase sigma factor [Demequina sp. SYSU T00b26]MDN4471398.1 sigma-70 family RNA polymerase sigma factor [Demequina sp. SYSU T00b26]